MELDIAELIYAMERAESIATNKANACWPDLEPKDKETYIKAVTLLEFLKYVEYGK